MLAPRAARAPRLAAPPSAGPRPPLPALRPLGVWAALAALALAALQAGCSAAASPPPALSPSPTAPRPEPTLPPASPVASVSTRPTATSGDPPRPPTPAATPARLATFRVGVKFDTYEAEETIQHELGLLPGVHSLVVTQLEIQVSYDPRKLSEAEILRVLGANPEVRLRQEPSAGG